MKMERNQNECEDDCKWKIEHIGQRKKLQCKKMKIYSCIGVWSVSGKLSYLLWSLRKTVIGRDKHKNDRKKYDSETTRPFHILRLEEEKYPWRAEKLSKTYFWLCNYNSFLWWKKGEGA